MVQGSAHLLHYLEFRVSTERFTTIYPFKADLEIIDLYKADLRVVSSNSKRDQALCNQI